MQGGDTKEPERRLAAAQGRRTNIGTRRQQSAINIDSFVSSFIDTRNKHTGESLNEQQTNCKWTGCLFLESIFQSETSYPFAAAAPRAAVQCGHDPRSTIHALLAVQIFSTPRLSQAQALRDSGICYYDIIKTTNNGSINKNTIQTTQLNSIFTIFFFSKSKFHIPRKDE